MCIPSHHSRVAAEFLLEWRQDIRGADCLPGDSQRAPGREAMGRLRCQAYTVGDFLLQQQRLLRSRSLQLCPLPELVCATDGAPSPSCQGGPTGRCTRLSALGWGNRNASRSVRRADIYQAREGFWRYE